MPGARRSFLSWTPKSNQTSGFTVGFVALSLRGKLLAKSEPPTEGQFRVQGSGEFTNCMIPALAKLGSCCRLPRVSRFGGLELEL